MSDWKNKIDEFARTTGRELIVVPQGRGVGFADGFDVCWILEKDVISTLPAPSDEADTGATIASFERVEQVRKDVLHVLRHYLASKNVGIERNASGSWGIQVESGMSSTISVGASLTALVRDGGDVEACLKALFKHSIIRHTPSAKRIARYLNTPGVPGNERGFEDKSIRLIGNTMADILKLLNLCRAADAIPDDPTEADGQKFAGRLKKVDSRGPIGEALMRVGDRLPDVQPSFECLEGSITLEFPDKLDSISLSPKNRTLVRQVRDDGPLVTGDRIADDFERVARLRKVTLRAIDQAAQNLGWMIEEASTGLLTGGKVWHVGAETRSGTIDVGEALTEALRKQSPEAFIRSIDGPSDFVKAALSAIDVSGEVVPSVVSFSATRGRLAPKPPTRVPPLVELTREVFAQTDAWASQALDAFKRSEDFWREIRDEARFDPAIDTWLTPDEIVRIAGQVAEDSWPFTTALRVQLDAGVVGIEAKAREIVARYDVLYEAGDDAIALCWRFRNEFPEMARQNFAPQPHDDVPHAEARAKAGDPIAIRYVESTKRVATDEEDDSTFDVLPPSLRALDARARAIAWAKREWRWSFTNREVFDRAKREGWTELADALDENPYLVATLLTHDVRGMDGFDSPGILLASELLLAWSRLKPTDLLARLIVTARNSDLIAEAHEAERTSAKRNPKISQSTLEMALTVSHSWWEQIQVPMAIAWTRWRNTRPG